MTKNKLKIKKLPFVILTAVLMCFMFMFGVLFAATPVFAISETPSSINSSYNLNFSANANSSGVYSNPTGWTRGPNTANNTSGVINLSKPESADTYFLTKDEMPSKILGSDDYALMLNPKTKNSSLSDWQYYTNASNIALSAYSNYKIKVFVKVNSSATASVYLTGLDNDLVSGLEDNLKFERIKYEDASEWTPYTFYISTGMDAQNVKLELWLGAKPQDTSSGAVFFDNIEVTQISENEIDVPATSKTIKQISLDKRTIASDINGDFEIDSLAEWTQIKGMANGSHAEIKDVTTIEGIKTDLSKNNKNAFVLYTDKDVKTYFGYKSNSLSLAMYDIVKVSVNVKVKDLEGSAYVKIVEDEVKDFKGEVKDSITPNSQSIAISSNSTNKFQNGYTTCTFYLKGRSLYNTSYKIELWLGSEETNASGMVAFDNIKLENVSYKDYTNASTDTNTVKIAFDSYSTKFNIANSSFNEVEKENKELTYPLTPASWTHTAKNDADIFFGVVNTNDSIYDAHKNEFGGFDNPGNPDSFGDTSIDTNNILLMHNFNKTYQSVKSSNFSVSSNSYYKLTFDYKLKEITSDVNLFNVYIVDDNSSVLYSHENIKNTNGLWKTYTIYVNTKAYTNTLNLVLSLGTEDTEVCGLVYIDNVALVKQDDMAADEYDELAKHNNVLDFEQGNFNLINKNENGIHTLLRYTESLENADNTTSGLKAGFGGIIDVNDTTYSIEKSPNSTGALSYVMLLQTMNKATYSLTAKDSLSLSSDTYHKFSVDIKTQGFAKGLEKDKKYGAVFALAGLDEKIDGVVAEDWTTYTIYVASTSSVTVNIKFALESLDIETAGNAFFDNFVYETIDKDAYNLAKLNADENDETKLFIGNTDTKDDDSDDSKTNLEYIWYVIPTLILALALILALVAYLMKKVNIKKWEKRKINEYDRDRTVHRDVIRAEAEKRRNDSVKELQADIQELEEEKQRIEAIHQEQLKASRTNRAKGVTKAEEREFKQYAKLHTALENRIANISKQIDKMNSAEYLLSVQHKIMLEKAKAERKAKEQAYEKDKLKKKKQK